MRALDLALEGVGRFASARGDVTLWAGVAELRRLHGAVAVALAPIGFEPEARPYRPHVSLARCGPNVRPELLSRFDDDGRRLRVPFLAKALGVYSSSRVDGDLLRRRPDSQERCR